MTTHPASGPLRYPLSLGTASFVWALVGWMVALHAPALAFVPTVDVLHVVFPSLTGLLILLNLRYALRALWNGERIERLMMVSALQIGLFTTLFHQIAAHVGAEHFKLTKPAAPAEWVQFSLAHALKASDVLDIIEAYGWNVQVIKHNGPFVGSLLVVYHGIVDLFVLGVLRTFVGAAKRKLMSDPGRAETVRRFLVYAFLLFLAVWLASALYFRPWRQIDIPLWLGENVVRVVDFSDAMDSYDIHWHQVPKEWQESTLTFVCRVWIFLGIAGVMGWLRRSKSVDETPSAKRVARLAFVGLLFVCFVGLPKVFPADAASHAVALATTAGERDDARSAAALNALSRMGPNAEAAAGPLVAALPKVTAERQRRAIDALGHLGLDALPHLVTVAEGMDADLAGRAVAGMDRVGTDAAPALVRVWKTTPHEDARRRADATLRAQGLEAMPKLIAAVTPETAADFYHWFEQLDRNWTLRRSKNEQFQSMVKDKVAAQEAEAAHRWEAKKVPALVAQLASADVRMRQVAAGSLGELGPGAKDAVPALVAALADTGENVRSAALESLGQIDPEWATLAKLAHCLHYCIEASDRRKAAEALGNGEAGWPKPAGTTAAVAALVTSLTDPDTGVRRAAENALGRIDPEWTKSAGGAAAVPALVSKMANSKQEVRGAAVEVIGKIGPAAKAAVPALIAELSDETYGRTKYEVEQSLGKIDSAWTQSAAAKEAVPALVAKLSDGDEFVRRAAAGALAKIGPAAVPALVAALTDPDSRVKVGAAEALGKIGPAAKSAVPALIAMLDIPFLDDVRESAAAALGKIDPAWPQSAAAKEAVPALIANLSATRESVRFAAADALAKIGPAAADAVSALKRLGDRDTNSDVRDAAKKAVFLIQTK